MSKLTIKKVKDAEDRTLSVFAEFDEIADRIRERAYDLFAHRGFAADRAMDDWLTAEREICRPTSELVESEGEYRLKVALAGFRPADVAVTATPDELVVKATRSTEDEEQTERGGSVVRWSEFCGSDIYRRIELPEQIDVGHVVAKLEGGMLVVVAPKANGKKPAKKKARKKVARKKAKKAAARSASKKAGKKRAKKTKE